MMRRRGRHLRTVHTQWELNAAVRDHVARIEVEETNGQRLVLSEKGVSVIVRHSGVLALRLGASAVVGLDGHADIYAGSWAAVLGGGTAFVEDEGRAVIHPGGTAVVHDGGFAVIQRDGWAEVTAGGQVTVRSGGEATLCAGARANVVVLDDIRAAPGSYVNILN